MIFISMATYFEAAPFIKKLNLKKDTDCTRFQLFKNKDIILIISGCGKIKSAVASAYMFSKNEPSSQDIFINAGLCGSSSKNFKKGEIFLCNKIRDFDTDNTYFTDILFRHPFKENSVVTCSKIIRDNFDYNNTLIDMESSSLYESASFFFQTHQIFFIKIISDFLDPDNINKEELKDILDKASSEIITWICDILKKYNYNKIFFTDNQLKEINLSAFNMKLSVTMKNELIQLIKYCILNNGNFDDISKLIMPLHCKSKKEGKIYLEKLRQKLI